MSDKNISAYFRYISAPILFIYILMFQFYEVSAQNEIPDSLVIDRTQYIQKMLDQGKPGAKIWWNGWLFGYTAATLGQGVVVLTSDKLKTRQDIALGAATTLLGAVGQLLTPMTPAFASGKLALLPADTPEQRKIKLHKAEELFAASAKREKEGRSWKAHAITGAANAGSGLITWLGFNRSIWAGIGNFAMNTVISEVQIWTQPTRAIKDYKKYCEKYQYGLAFKPSKPKSHLFVSAYPGGLAVRMIF